MHDSLLFPKYLHGIVVKKPIHYSKPEVQYATAKTEKFV